MNTIELLQSPWYDTFVHLVESTEDTLRFLSPFVKRQAVGHVIEHKKTNVKVHLVTTLQIAHFYYGSIDVDALRQVIDDGGDVRNHQALHSKVYLFDERHAVVTSANLTMGGLKTNHEYGVLISDAQLVKQIVADFDQVSSNEFVGVVQTDTLDEIEEILRKAPKHERLELAEIDTKTEEQEGELLLEASEEGIRNALEGWKLDTFDAIARLEQEVFELPDVYEFVPQLAEKHPGNRHIEEKLRQQLQLLRDLGLVKFYGGGRYRKLWTTS